MCPFHVKALPDGYQVLPSEDIRHFTFFEDQPYVKEPPAIDFHSFLNQGKVVVLHLWATSCPSCVRELPMIEQVATAMKNQPIQFVVISLNDPTAGVLRNYFNRSHYLAVKPYHRPSLTRPVVKGIPTTLFFNRAGKLVGKFEGVVPWQSQEMQRLLDRLCEESYIPEVSTDWTNLETWQVWAETVMEKMRKWADSVLS